MLASLLPLPKHAGAGAHQEPQFPTIEEVRQVQLDIPPYGKRHGFVPRNPEDFGDGGAFPEIHISQFPLGMGRKENMGKETRIVPLQVDADGKVSYDAIVKQNMRPGTHLQSRYKDLAEKDVDKDSLQRPSAEEEQKIAEKTRLALSKIVDLKIATAQPTHVAKQNQEPVFLRYTPQQAVVNDNMNSGAKQRIIKVQDMPVDPLEPAKFKTKKLPNSKDSPPVPVMHSPPRKVTVQDQQNWKIPPCISNWKNIKGYTIPLDKRLAADGRGLIDVQVNPNFAKLSEALYTTEQVARQNIEARAKMQQRAAAKKKAAKEQELDEMARKAHEEIAALAERRGASELTEEDIEKREEREELRRDRERDLKRDFRMERMKDDKIKKKTVDDAERDISEKIALGQAPGVSKDAMFDQRLFNQAQGMSQGFSAEDSYDVYDKPLFKPNTSTYIYRADKNAGGDPMADEPADASDSKVKALLEQSKTDTSKFKPDREFKGASDSAASQKGSRQKPVEFEKSSEDPFGMVTGKAADERRPNALESIGRRGQMSASAGATQGQEYSSRHDSSRKMDFEESRSSRGTRRSRSRSRSRGRDRERDKDREDRDKRRRRD